MQIGLSPGFLNAREKSHPLTQSTVLLKQACLYTQGTELQSGATSIHISHLLRGKINSVILYILSLKTISTLELLLAHYWCSMIWVSTHPNKTSCLLKAYITPKALNNLKH